MTRNWIEIVETPIDSAAVLSSVQDPECGANLLFCGTTRQLTDGRETERLEYECYREMAVKELEKLISEVRVQWPVRHCAIVHRIGEVGVGEASIAVAVSSPHRVAAFQSGEWLMNELKKRVPIWKKEIWTDGSSEWQHPTASN